MWTIEECLEYCRSLGVQDSEAIAHLEDELSELRWAAFRHAEMAPPGLGHTAIEGPYAGLPARCITVLERYGLTRESVTARIQADPEGWWIGMRNTGPVTRRKIERWITQPDDARERVRGEVTVNGYTPQAPEDQAALDDIVAAAVRRMEREEQA